MKDKPSSPPTKEVTIIAVLIVLATVLLVLLARQPVRPPSPALAPLPLSRGTVPSPPPGGPSGQGKASPLPVAPRNDSAVKGEIAAGELLYGTITLEDSPNPLTPQQAEKIADALEGKCPQARLAHYLSAKVEEVLNERQKAYLVKKAAENVEVPVEQKKAVQNNLDGLAGLTAAPPEVRVPAGYRVVVSILADGSRGEKSVVPYFDSLAANYTEMMGNPQLALSSQQARALAPLMSTAPSTRLEAAVLDSLTPEQKEYIDRVSLKDGKDHTKFNTSYVTYFRNKARGSGSAPAVASPGVTASPTPEQMASPTPERMASPTPERMASPTPGRQASPRP